MAAFPHSNQVQFASAHLALITNAGRAKDFHCLNQ
jgi:hypothetical protein